MPCEGLVSRRPCHNKHGQSVSLHVTLCEKHPRLWGAQNRKQARIRTHEPQGRIGWHDDGALAGNDYAAGNWSFFTLEDIIMSTVKQAPGRSRESSL